MSTTSTVDIEINVNGKPIKQYKHNDNVYIEARNGTEYSIRIKNNGYNKRLAIVTVDGLNVITGKPQGNDTSNGYIVNSRSSIDIKGFRKDTESVGAFKFCNKSKAYCNEQGLAGNNGVIGVRMYDEEAKFPLYNYIQPDRRSPIIDPHFYKSSIIDYSTTYTTSNDTPVMKGSVRTLSNNDINYCCSSSLGVKESPSFDVGTTWGQKVKDSIVYVDFEADNHSHNDYIIYYDTRENLEKIGINFKVEKQMKFPKAFDTFATPPKEWRG